MLRDVTNRSCLKNENPIPFLYLFLLQYQLDGPGGHIVVVPSVIHEDKGRVIGRLPLRLLQLIEAPRQNKMKSHSVYSGIGFPIGRVATEWIIPCTKCPPMHSWILLLSDQIQRELVHRVEVCKVSVLVVQQQCEHIDGVCFLCNMDKLCNL